MIRNKHKHAYKHQLEEELKELRGYSCFDKYTQTAILDHLFGSGEYRSESELMVVHRYNPYNKSKWWQRLNKLWVYPLLTITLPFQWLIRGETGVTKGSTLGDILDKVIGTSW